MNAPWFLGGLTRRGRSFCAASLLLFSSHPSPAQSPWAPAKGPLLTKWAKDVSPKNAHQEYPRPQMARPDWQNLNGLWDYAITDKEASVPKQWAGKILVPFPIQSALSGVMTNLNESQRLWYLRRFEIRPGWKDKRVLLHFGAVDWETTVWVNGREIGRHSGGYDGFSFDITEALATRAENEIVVSVWDPTDAGPQPRGKQVRKPGGIWYTPTSGIWQTVWLEPVSAVHIQSLKITPNLDDQSVKIETVLPPGPNPTQIDIEIMDGRRVIETASLKQDRSGGNAVPTRATIVAKVQNPKLWSPENPHLYGLRITVRVKA